VELSEAIDPLDQVERSDVLVVCNPNNPDGRKWSCDRLLEARSQLVVAKSLCSRVIIEDSLKSFDDWSFSCIQFLQWRHTTTTKAIDSHPNKWLIYQDIKLFLLPAHAIYYQDIHRDAALHNRHL